MCAVMAYYAGSNDGVWLPSAASATYTIPTDCTQQSPPPSFQVLLLATLSLPSEWLSDGFNGTESGPKVGALADMCRAFPSPPGAVFLRAVLYHFNCLTLSKLISSSDPEVLQGCCSKCRDTAELISVHDAEQSGRGTGVCAGGCEKLGWWCSRHLHLWIWEQ